MVTKPSSSPETDAVNVMGRATVQGQATRTPPRRWWKVIANANVATARTSPSAVSGIVTSQVTGPQEGAVVATTNTQPTKPLHQRRPTLLTSPEISSSIAPEVTFSQSSLATLAASSPALSSPPRGSGLAAPEVARAQSDVATLATSSNSHSGPSESSSPTTPQAADLAKNQTTLSSPSENISSATSQLERLQSDQATLAASSPVKQVCGECILQQKQTEEIEEKLKQAGVENVALRQQHDKDCQDLLFHRALTENVQAKLKQAEAENADGSDSTTQTVRNYSSVKD
ncbi:hypothetical protein BKA62DRAFT_777261 [Auriculariales sp. MPI-PUGE-AT-0066]|nr:hypothetical protein BKA62DRAFT_777261 [Auriculariales sp. MPI-PUGE-AT-0066]